MSLIAAKSGYETRNVFLGQGNVQHKRLERPAKGTAWSTRPTAIPFNKLLPCSKYPSLCMLQLPTEASGDTDFRNSAGQDYALWWDGVEPGWAGAVWKQRP